MDSIYLIVALGAVVAGFVQGLSGLCLWASCQIVLGLLTVSGIALISSALPKLLARLAQ